MKENGISLKTFASRLKQLREEKDLSQETVSKATDVSKATLSKYENELREPKIKYIKRLADYFRVDINWLMGYSNIKEPGIDSKNLSEIFDSLSDDGKRELVNYAKYLKQKETEG